MVFFSIIACVVLIYYLIYLIVPRFIDCDLKLFIYGKLGKPINSLEGKVVWITGASSGIGEHLAYALAKGGCKLILSARRQPELLQVKTNCLTANPTLHESDIQVVVFDVRAYESHRKVFDTVVKIFGRLDILVNNAGRSQRATWESIDTAVDKEVFKLNTFSVVSLSRLAIKYFAQTGSGHIVVTSSMAGIIGAPFSASYTGSKHALHGYFDCLRMEKMHENLAITMVCPGPIQTNFLEESFTDRVGQKYGIKTEIAKNKIDPGRCGKLMAIAIANKLPEVWIAHSNVLQLVYLIKYYPNLAPLIMRGLGRSFFQHMRDSKITVTTR